MQPNLETLLCGTFLKQHVTSAHGHFLGIVSGYEKGDWEDAVAKSGKFIEAALKALGCHARASFPTGRKFSAGGLIDILGRLPAGTVDDTIRLTIPRACRFAYDLASNRGARHDPDEINPNLMDANAAIVTCSWILAEMVRYAQRGAIDPSEAQRIIESLTIRRYPLIEEVEGRVYFHHKKKSAPDVALLTLAYRYPDRVQAKELSETIERHGFTRANARMAVSRIRGLVDDDGHGNLKALNPALRKAEEIMDRG